MALPRIGLQAVFQDAQFRAGITNYNAQVQQATAETERAATQITQDTEGIGQSWLSSAEAVGIGAAAIGTAVAALLTKLALTRARTDELGIVLERVGANIGKTADEMHEYEAGVKAMGIRTDAARQALIQMTQANIDLSRATELARLAQDAAVISQKDSSEAFEYLITLTQRGSLLMARQLGLVVSWEDAYDRLAVQLGTTADALTLQEKQQARLEEVLRAGANIAGAYEAAMGSASKQLRSMPRYIDDLSNELGESLQPVMGLAVRTGTDLLKWAIAMPDPLRDTIVQVSALAAGLSILGGTAVTVIPKLLAMVAALGPVGIAGALLTAGAAFLIYRQNLAEANRETAASILATTDTYDDYIRAMEDADLGSIALTEQLWLEAEGHLAAADAAERHAEALQWHKAAEGALGYLDAIVLAADADTQFLDGATQLLVWQQSFEEGFRRNAEVLSIQELQFLKNRDAVYEWARGVTDSGEEARALTDYIVGLAREYEEYYQETQRHIAAQPLLQQIWEDQTTALTELESTYTRFAGAIFEVTGGLRELAEAAGLASASAERLEAVQDFLADIEKLEQDSAKAILRAQESADKQRRTARENLLKSLAQLEEDHAQRVMDLQEQIAALPAQLAADMYAAEQDAAQQRERLHADMLERMADAEDAYHDAVRDAAEDLAEDLAGIERDHEKRMESLRASHLRDMAEMEADYYADLEALAEDYGDKVAAITEKYARERQSILDKYRLDVDPSIDEQREALLDQIRELEKLQGRGTRGIWYGQDIADLKEQLEALKELELAALEERKQAELDELAAWYDEEQAVRDAAYQAQIDAEQAAYEEQIANEQAAYEERRAERLAQYQEQLADLKERLQEQQEAIRESYQDQIQALQDRLAEEKQRLAQAAAEQTARLQAQIAEERQNYQDRYQDLVQAHGDRKAEIDRALGEEQTAIRTSAQQSAQEYLDAVEGIGPGVQDALQRMAVYNLQPALDDWVRRFQDAAAAAAAAVRGTMESGLEAQSPSKWAIRLGANVGESFGVSMQTALEEALAAFQPTVQGALLADVGQTPSREMASVLGAPPVVDVGTTTAALPAPAPAAPSQTTYEHNLTVEANYQQAQSEASLREDLFLYQQMLQMRTMR